MKIVSDAGAPIATIWNYAIHGTTLAGVNLRFSADVMGQRLLFFAGLVIVIVVGLIPATLSAAVVFWVAQLLLSIPLAVALGVVAALAVLLAEVAMGIGWLGGHFERFDLSSELRS